MYITITVKAPDLERKMSHFIDKQEVIYSYDGRTMVAT